MEKTTFDKVNKLAELALNLANYVDREGEKNLLAPIAEHLHLGYRTLSNYLRNGVKACIDMQDMYSEAILKKDLAESSEEGARDFLEECFGDREIDSINDKDKARILNLCKQIEKEWEEDEQ